MKDFQINDPDEATIYAHLAGDDHLSVVLKASVYIENQLDRLIAEHTKSSEAVKRMNLDFERKLDLALVLGLHPRFRAPIKAISTLRNRFAHSLESTLTKSDTDAIYQALSSDDKPLMHALFEKAKKPDIGAKRFRDLSPLDQFQLLSIALRGALISARDQGTPGVVISNAGTTK